MQTQDDAGNAEVLMWRLMCTVHLGCPERQLWSVSEVLTMHPTLCRNSTCSVQGFSVAYAFALCRGAGRQRRRIEQSCSDSVGSFVAVYCKGVTGSGVEHWLQIQDWEAELNISLGSALSGVR